MNMNKKDGFTLLELSLVVTVIGLIVGGVLIGRSLIFQGQLRTIMAEKAQYETAIKGFKEKYQCLPGDCRRATELFGSAGGNDFTRISDGSCTNEADTKRGSTGTCNGNGDGKIGVSGDWGVGPVYNYEHYIMWQHLALAKIVPGTFGVYGIGISYGHKRGENTMPSKSFSNAFWTTLPSDNFADAQRTFASGYATIGHQVLTVGLEGHHPSGFYYPPQAILTPREAFGLDQKHDDGRPLTGNFSVNVADGGSEAGGYWGDRVVEPCCVREDAEYHLGYQADSRIVRPYFIMQQ